MRCVLGITGNSGAGKTVTGLIINKLTNAYIVNADSVVKELSKPGSLYYLEIRKTFGDDFFDENNNLIRNKLANEIYSNEESLNKLNNLTFKFVVDEIKGIINKNKDKDLIVIDAPLLFESGLNSLCDKTISLIASRNIKINRIMKRDNLSREVAINRLSIQKDDSFYKERSDYLIQNENEEELENKIKEILDKLEINY